MRALLLVALFGLAVPLRAQPGPDARPLGLLLLVDTTATTSALRLDPRGEDALARADGLRLDAEAVGPPGLSRRGALEAGAVVLTGVLHLATSQAGARRVFIPAVALGWGGYLGVRARQDPDFLRTLGLTRRHLGPAFRDATLAAVGSAAAMAAIGAAQGTLTLNGHAVPLMALYPAWGLVQQTLTQGMVARNLDDAGVSPFVTVPVTAGLFGLVHLPNVRLAAGTTALGLVFTPLYLKHRNLWPLGLYHGVLGVLFYFWVLDKDPWTYLEH